MTYDGKLFEPETFMAAWHRRPNYFGEHKDPLRWLSLKDEYGSLMKTIAELIPDKRWLNTARDMQRAGIKLPQLIKAAEHGFTIPETVVSNGWESVETLESDNVIVKLAEMTVLYPKGGRKTLPTTIIPRATLPKHIPSYPGIWQTYHAKKKEWRVTVISETVLSAAIYTDKDAKDDWRKHQDGPNVNFKVEDFPKSLASKCVSFLKSLGLRYGAFDFIEQPDGQIVFLEVNPNGQFMWLQDILGLPISEAIAEELIEIARNT
jgi:glutathione synthase/RimK-type ligase-like ATP-grasp enzyme